MKNRWENVWWLLRLLLIHKLVGDAPVAMNVKVSGSITSLYPGTDGGVFTNVHVHHGMEGE